LSIETCRLVQLPKISDPSGNLTFIEGERHIPFEIKRVYYLYDVPEGRTRGRHAHKAVQQFIVAVAGSVTLVLNDSHRRKEFLLNRACCGVYVPRMTWQELKDFSPGSVCLVLASETYDEADYYRDYADFLAAVRGGLE
jgi:dTDP-4-dehydrorhamnose 3,5-epimerase-like enzyme